MNSTKSEILALLKRNGGRTVKDLAAATRVAPITVRQHLTHLQRDGLVSTERSSQAAGPPFYVYRLSAKGQASAFPRRSDRLVELLVHEVGALDGSELEGLSSREKTRLVLQRLAHRLADEYASLLQDWPLHERVVFVTEVMHADGGFAEWEKTERGYQIRDFNCLFHRLLDGDGQACEWHRSFLSRALGTEVRVSPCTGSSGQCCRYEIEPLPVGQPALAAASPA